MSFTYELVKEYDSFDRKEEIVDILVRTEKEFVPHLSVWRDGATVKDKMNIYIKPSDQLLLAIDNETNKIIGFFHLKVDYKEDKMEAYQPNLKIETLTTLPEYRGRGVATALYREIDILNQNYFKKPFIVSATWEGHEKQQYLFEKNNYKIVLVTTYPQSDALKRCYFVKKV